jgi:hypothetical protein
MQSSYEIARLASVEARLSGLIHPLYLPQWIDEKMVRAPRDTEVSRLLITCYQLPVLNAANFDRPWKLAVLGGAPAVLALHRSIAGSVLAHWLREAIDGVVARRFQAELPAELVREAWSSFLPWCGCPLQRNRDTSITDQLNETASSALDYLWRLKAPQLLPWMRLMTKSSSVAANAEAPCSDDAIEELSVLLSDAFNLSDAPAT